MTRGVLKKLYKSGNISNLQEVFHKKHSGEIETIVIIDGEKIQTIDGTIFSSLSSAALYFSGHDTNGWVYWYIIKENGKKVYLSQIRAQMESQ